MKWKVMYSNGEVVYYHPTDVQIVMSGCTLKNSRTAAQKIYTGETTKVVCAWVLCDEVKIITQDFKTESNTRLKYNPRELPYWNLNGKNMDGENVKELFSVDYKLFLK
jgi:hypothetical protein